MLPKKFSGSQESATASYDYFDIANGSGMVRFYLGYVSASYVMSQSLFYSGACGSTNNVTTTPAKVLDLDFDLLLNKPLSIKGTLIANCPLYIQAGSVYFIIKLRKWDGTTETEICEGTSNTLAGSAVWRVCAAMSTVPATTFKAGEYLRVTIEVWGTASSGSQQARIGHDPMNLTDTIWTTASSISQSSVQIPIRIDI